MAIETATGGEVLTYEQALSELQAGHKEAVTDLEDSQALAHRADEDSNRWDLMAASLESVNFDPDLVARVRGLAELAARRKAAAQERAAAADAMAAETQALLQLVQGRHGLMADAVANTPNPADTQFYKN